jgi:hypothetical protein
MIQIRFVGLMAVLAILSARLSRTPLTGRYFILMGSTILAAIYPVKNDYFSVV